MDTVITAGGLTQPGDLLYEVLPGGYKAFLDIAGKAMIQWVLDALSAAKTIERVVIVGLKPDCGVTCSKPLTFVPDQDDLVANIRAGVLKVLELNPSAEYVLAATSDVPAITGEMVDWVVNSAMETEHDLYYNVISREVMEKRFPGSRRSYLRLKDIEACGGDINVLRASVVSGRDDVWKRLVASRKNALKQAALIGYDTLFLVMFRLITMEGAVKMVSKRLGLRGRAVVCPYAEIGMDVDKPFQLEIMRADLSRSKPG